MSPFLEVQALIVKGYKALHKRHNGDYQAMLAEAQKNQQTVFSPKRKAVHAGESARTQTGS